MPPFSPQRLQNFALPRDITCSTLPRRRKVQPSPDNANPVPMCDYEYLYCNGMLLLPSKIG